MNEKNITLSRQKPLYIWLAIFLILGLWVMRITFGIDGSRLLSQFSWTNMTPANASSQWQASSNNPYASQVWTYKDRVNQVIQGTLYRGAHLTPERFLTYLNNLALGIQEMSKKPAYANNADVQNIVGYISYELDEAKKSFSGSNTFFSDYSNLVDQALSGTGSQLNSSAYRSQTGASQVTQTPTAEQIANEKKMRAEQALFSSKYYICYVEEKIWQKCDEYITEIGFTQSSYTNPKNTWCTERYKADPQGWALVFLPKNEVYRLSGWGCAQGSRKQYCRVGSRTEVSTEKMEQETGILGIRGTDIWSPSRVGYFPDRFTASSNASGCSSAVDGDLYWRQDMTESGGILMPEITISRTNDADSQTLSWTTTANTEKLAWECTGWGNQNNMMTSRTISNQNEALRHTSTRTTWKEFQTNGWSAGTWNCTWKISGNGVVNTHMESFKIEAAPVPPADPNAGMFGLKPKFTLSRTCDGAPCSTIIPGNISYGANWTTEKAQEVSFTCTGPTTSTQTGKKIVVGLNMSANFSKYQDLIDAGWTPGSYNCTWKILGFDGSATLFTDTFTMGN